MLATWASLGTACVAFGASPTWTIHTIVAPAASALLHPNTVADGVLRGSTSLPRLDVGFSYWKPSDLLIVGGTVLAAVLIGRRALRWTDKAPAPWPFRMLARAHTGSVNDYAGFAIAEILVTLTVLLL